MSDKLRARAGSPSLYRPAGLLSHPLEDSVTSASPLWSRYRVCNRLCPKTFRCHQCPPHTQSTKDTQYNSSPNQHSLLILIFTRGFVLTPPANSVAIIIKENQADDAQCKTRKNKLSTPLSFFRTPDGSSQPQLQNPQTPSFKE